MSVHPCDRCGRSFTSLQGLSQHRCWHDMVTCDLCARIIPREALDEHTASQHGVPVDRDSAEQNGTDGAEQDSSEAAQAEDLQLHCPFCEYTCWSPENLAEHQQSCENNLMTFSISGSRDELAIMSSIAFHPPNYPQFGIQLYLCAWCDLRFTKKAICNHLRDVHQLAPIVTMPTVVYDAYRKVDV